MKQKIDETVAFSLDLSHFRKLFDNAASGGNAPAKSVGNNVHQISLQFECNFPLQFQDKPLQIMHIFRVFLFNVVFEYSRSGELTGHCKI